MLPFDALTLVVAGFCVVTSILAGCVGGGEGEP